MQESIVFLLRVQCRRKESSRSLSHLPMSFLFLKLLLKNCAVDFVEICKVCARRTIIKAAKRIINSDKIAVVFEFWRHFFWNTVYSVLFYALKHLSPPSITNVISDYTVTYAMYAYVQKQPDLLQYLDFV